MSIDYWGKFSPIQLLRVAGYSISGPQSLCVIILRRRKSLHTLPIGIYMQKLVSLISMLAALILCTLPLTGLAETLKGQASYYADSLQGNKTASGEPYDKSAMTAAHRTLELGTRVKVTYLKTGKSVEVKINDRGPNAKGRVIDLSGAAAEQLGLKDDGHGEVEIEVSR
jgi:rare lipoprotein A